MSESMDTRHIHISDYNYPLPDECIAKFPVAQRDHSRLLVYRHGEVSDDIFCHLPDYLPEGALMVFNNTKVIQARMHFRKTSGALIEIFLLEPAVPADYEQMFQTSERCSWYCLVGNLKKWKEGTLERTITIKRASASSSLPSEETFTVKATRKGVHGTSQIIEFEWDSPHSATLSFSEIIDAMGELPIPPYLNRDTQESDKTTYQTVYSKIKGSVAAPTAGLHFTPQVLADLDAHGIDREELTLHVGAGTFKPVKSEEIADHEMHTEFIAVRRQTIEKLLKHQCQAIAVGTTSVRTLESLYYMGLKVLVNPDITEEELHVSQWEPYEREEGRVKSEKFAAADEREKGRVKSEKFAAADEREEGKVKSEKFAAADEREEEKVKSEDSLRVLLGWMDRNGMQTLHSSTQIIIAPGYEYKIVKMLVTNFHQPQSTLLLLVSAFVHGDWRTIYDYALAHDFRFLSYGDSSLLIP